MFGVLFAHSFNIPPNGLLFNANISKANAHQPKRIKSLPTPPGSPVKTVCLDAMYKNSPSANSRLGSPEKQQKDWDPLGFSDTDNNYDMGRERVVVVMLICANEHCSIFKCMAKINK